MFTGTDDTTKEVEYSVLPTEGRAVYTWKDVAKHMKAKLSRTNFEVTFTTTQFTSFGHKFF